MNYSKTTVAFYSKAAIALFEAARTGIPSDGVQEFLRKRQACNKVLEAGKKLGIFEERGSKLFSTTSYTSAEVGKIMTKHFSSADRPSTAVKPKRVAAPKARAFQQETIAKYAEYIDALRKMVKGKRVNLSSLASKYHVGANVLAAINKLKIIKDYKWSSKFETTSSKTIAKKVIRQLHKEYAIKTGAVSKAKTIPTAVKKTVTKRPVSSRSVLPLDTSSRKQKIEIAKKFTELGEYDAAQKLLNSI